jgi:hypothetical protein
VNPSELASKMSAKLERLNIMFESLLARRITGKFSPRHWFQIRHNERATWTASCKRLLHPRLWMFPADESAVTGDHARQEQVCDNVSRSGFDEPYQIRRMLTENTIRASDRRALFVGPAAYEQAGGLILRDLFEDDDGGWLQDVAPLGRLVTEKLKTEAEATAAEGWKWISVAVDFHMATIMVCGSSRGRRPIARARSRSRSMRSTPSMPGLRPISGRR